MALNFPSSPNDGDTYTFNGITYKYNTANTVWVMASNESGGTIVGRALTISTANPSGGANGDIWIKII